MLGQVLIIGRFVVLEAWRTRLPWIVVVAFALVSGLSIFVKGLAITESSRVQIAFLAALTRLAVVSVTSLYIVSTLAREFNDRVVDLTLSLELPRTAYVLGKLAGYAAVSAALAAAAGLLLVPVAWGPGLVAWTATLMLELWIVVALSIFCIITFNQVMPAASFVLAFYLLARSIGAIQLISASPLLANQSVAHRFADGLLNAMAYLLPTFDRFTETAWLVGSGPSTAGLISAFGQTLVYVPLLTTAALVDFYRKTL